MDKPKKLVVKKPSNWKLWRNLSITGLIIIALIVCFIIWRRPIIDFFQNKDAVQDFIKSAGIFAPLIFIILQIAQVIIAPIPGQIIGLVGGYLFDIWGILLTFIGTTLGFTIVFLIARKHGRPLVEKIFKPGLIKKFDFITKSKGTLILFLIFLLPTFPDDLICYLAGLTQIPIRKLILVSVLGRLPGLLILNLIGIGFAIENIRPIIAVVIAAIIMLAIAYWQRSWLHQLIKSESVLKYIKSNWRLSLSKTILVAVLSLIIIAALVFLAVLPTDIALFGQ